MSSLAKSVPAVSIFLILFLYYFYLFFKIIIIFLTLEVGKKKTLFFSFFNWHSCWRVHQFTNRLHYLSWICFSLFWVVGISCFFEARFRCLSLCRRRLVTHLIVFYVAFALFLLLSGPLFFFSLPLTSIQTRQICHSCSLSYLNVFLRLCIDLNQRDLTMKRRLVCVRVPANGGKVFNV